MYGVKKLFVFKSLLTTPSKILPLHLKQTFLPIIWILTISEGDMGLNFRLPFKIFYTLIVCFTNLPLIEFSLTKLIFSSIESRGFLYNVFCAGGIDKENPLNPKDNRENGVMVFFRDRIGPILNNGWTKFLVMLLFVFYLGVSSWGVSQLREGLERRKLSRYDSYTVAYYDTEDLYFREYPYRVNVSFELIFII